MKFIDKANKPVKKVQTKTVNKLGSIKENIIADIKQTKVITKNAAQALSKRVTKKNENLTAIEVNT